MLEQKLNEELKIAMKSRDEIRSSVIRMLKSDIQNTAIKLNKNNLTDDDVLKIIQKAIKQHMDSIDQFRAGNRPDLVDKETAELAILKQYVPEQISDEQLEAVVKDAAAGLGAATPKDMGKVIKAVMEKIKGQADGKRVSQAAAKILGGK